MPLQGTHFPPVYYFNLRLYFIMYIVCGLTKNNFKVKLGTLSRPLEKQLTNTSLEKLNELTLNIFNINSEEDVLKIIC